MKTFDVMIREAAQRRGGPVALREPGTSPRPPRSREVTDLGEAFRRLGLSEREVRIAVAGREGRVAEGVGIPGVPGDEVTKSYSQQGFTPSDFMWCDGTDVDTGAFGQPLVAKAGDTEYSWAAVALAVHYYAGHAADLIPAADRPGVEAKLKKAWQACAPSDAPWPSRLIDGPSGSAEARRPGAAPELDPAVFRRLGLSPREAAIAAAGRR